MNLHATADALLRGTAREVAAPRVRDLLVLLLLAGFAYGIVLGSHRLVPLQILYSAVKVPILLTASSLVCLPAFCVVTTLLGLREDLRELLRGIVASQTAMALVLASLAPCTAFVYASSADYRLAIVWNGGMFLLASLAGQLYLGRVFAPLIARDPRHRHGKLVWTALYVFVTIQLAWMLRPFVGTPGLPTTFFRQGVWDNAYEVVFEAVYRLFAG